ncbi:carbohydrate ABC transporter substrate-binding protein (CUT1 family) [Salinibacterium amurskyense]|uniref:Carbohydrate ABC transporter substrate-binding protein (CUT1 family) n=1 Tax=Salinibacterium amurskyense TaxID=205941 RepID=A0A2M9D6V1_9MICO|nr:ABC transporter substrate-binding protein [Salinibacterium amurskyense]PJJ81368.1 carbohydrate ABC transporter substrate-binding protein (CUT1 family) [Salinibacterium amurskyense]RLQ83371.1 carbohydrate ABC transporter substrate-binding protein [Salinibacterium amurskyense]GHD80741.1 alpha-glucoside ABC transporter substrate-binding protein [Salinibacterium amurskyense]
MISHNFRRAMLPIATLGVASMVLSGCASGTSGTGGPGDAGEADGVVTIYGTIADTEAELLEESWADWEEANDIDIQYESSKEFEAQISIRAQGGNAPDIAIFPQPGLLADLASRDYIQPAPEGVASNVAEYWSEDWAAYGTTGDTLYGAPLMASVKGFVWYSPSQFAEWGVEVPETWDELLALTQTIADETGTAPWCAGFGSDAATGWPGTDWVEDLVLREAGPDVYDQWVSHEIPFSDPAIVSAFDSVGEILLNPDYVNAGFGDVKSINSTPFGDPARALGDGSCALHHQASFFDGFIQDPKNGNATVGPDADIWAFVTPSVEAGGNAVTGGGEIVGAFSNDEDTIAVQEFLSSPEWANARVKLGGVISANNGLDPESASSPILQQAITILQDPDTTFRFDASDLMPGVVGAGSFWTGMVDWINGKSTEEVLSTIDASWPSE